jgi:hypothetical protein
MLWSALAGQRFLFRGGLTLRFKRAGKPCAGSKRRQAAALQSASRNSPVPVNGYGVLL